MEILGVLLIICGIVLLFVAIRMEQVKDYPHTTTILRAIIVVFGLWAIGFGVSLMRW